MNRIFIIIPLSYLHNIVCIYTPVSLQEDTVFALGLGISLTFLLTAIISSLLASLITYLRLVRSRSHRSAPPVQEPVPTRSTVRARSDIELKPNLAYGQITSIRSDEPGYETILPWVHSDVRYEISVTCIIIMLLTILVKVEAIISWHFLGFS